MMLSVLDTGGHQNTFHRCVHVASVLMLTIQCLAWKAGSSTRGMMMYETYLQPSQGRMPWCWGRAAPWDFDRRSAKQQCQLVRWSSIRCQWSQLMAKGAEGILGCKDVQTIRKKPPEPETWHSLFYVQSTCNRNWARFLQSRCCILWYNPPFSKNVSTNIGHRFLALVYKHFPKDHKLLITLIKISYSCMNNTKQIIDNHNKRILTSSQANDAATTATTEVNKTCNCRQKLFCIGTHNLPINKK